MSDAAEVLVPIAILCIPIVAIAGGLTAGIARMIGQQRLIELSQRERIAAIERGVDLDKLPPLPEFPGGDGLGSMYMSRRTATLRMAQGLVIGGLVTLAVGIGLTFMLYMIPDARNNNAWSVGFIPGLVGIALLASSVIVRRDVPAEDRPAGQPRP